MGDIVCEVAEGKMGRAVHSIYRDRWRQTRAYLATEPYFHGRGIKGLDRYVRGGPDGNRKGKTGEEGARVEEKLYHTDAVYL